jgi:hypothetical protein
MWIEKSTPMPTISTTKATEMRFSVPTVTAANPVVSTMPMISEIRPTTVRPLARSPVRSRMPTSRNDIAVEMPIVPKTLSISSARSAGSPVMPISTGAAIPGGSEATAAWISSSAGLAGLSRVVSSTGVTVSRRVTGPASP